MPPECVIDEWTTVALHIPVGIPPRGLFLHAMAKSLEEIAEKPSPDDVEAVTLNLVKDLMGEEVCEEVAGYRSKETALRMVAEKALCGPPRSFSFY